LRKSNFTTISHAGNVLCCSHFKAAFFIQEVIAEAEKLNLSGNHLFHSLPGLLYSDLDVTKALQHFHLSLNIAESKADKATINRLTSFQ
jgi:hypothetical protein